MRRLPPLSCLFGALALLWAAAASADLPLGRGPTEAQIAAGVAEKGFYDGPPIGAAACARCHPDVAAAWGGSAHRFASFNNPYYRAGFAGFRRDRGAEATPFCGRCHDPALVAAEQLAGADPHAPATFSTANAQAGLVCLTCHSIHTPPPLTGNGLFTLTDAPVPTRGPDHNRRVAAPALRSVNLCATCHRVALTPDVTADAWFKGQDEYGDWLASPSGAGHPGVIWPAPQARCVDCHMPKVPASPQEKGARGGRVADHRFLGANGALAHLRGDEAMVEATGAMLRGAASVDLQPGAVPGDAHAWVDVVLHNRRAGHRLPGGTQDSNQVWLEVRFTDAAGETLWRSGGLGPDGVLDPRAHRVRAQPVTEAGDPLTTRDAHNTRGVVYDTTLPQGQPRLARYQVPEGAARVHASLRYRKFDRAYLALACRDLPSEIRRRCETPPIYEIASAEAALDDGALGASAQEPADDRPRWARWVDHGLALSEGLPDDALHALAPLQRAQAATDDPIPVAALARALGRLGRTDELAALSAATPSPALEWYKAMALGRAYRTPAALAHGERALAARPRAPAALAFVARIRGVLQRGDALAAADALITQDPYSEAGWFHRMMSLRDEDRPALAGLIEVAADTWGLIRKTDERNLELRRIFRTRWPDQAPLLLPLPTYTPAPSYTQAR